MDAAQAFIEQHQIDGDLVAAIRDLLDERARLVREIAAIKSALTGPLPPFVRSDEEDFAALGRAWPYDRSGT